MSTLLRPSLRAIADDLDSEAARSEPVSEPAPPIAAPAQPSTDVPAEPSERSVAADERAEAPVEAVPVAEGRMGRQRTRFDRF